MTIHDLCYKSITHLQVRKKDIFKRLRLKLVWLLFPATKYGYTGNRYEREIKLNNIQHRLIVSDLSKPDELSWEEMHKHLDTFLNRKISHEEWQTVLLWKSSYHVKF